MLVRAVLFLTVALPALAVSLGRADGRVVFVLYREPKLVAALCLSWILLAAVAWTRPEAFRLAALVETARRPAVWLGLAAGGWLAVTGLWVQVRPNWTYEMVQYVTFGALFVVLVTWSGLERSRSEPSVLRTVQWALVASVGVVTLIGLCQWAGLSLPALSSLAPIRPDIGAPHPSLMGYKNPAALAVVGQLFVLMALVWRTKSRRLRAAWTALLVLEILYVVSLGSRTAVLALAVGLTTLLVLGLLTLRGADSKKTGLIRASVGLVVLFAVALGAASAASPALRERLGTMVGFAFSPSAYLESDRGVYLRNTVHMARHEPLGVGLGDWQTAYPVYRAFGRSVSFDESFEVRRAHGDHVQMLGEAGWVGLGLWLAWLGALVFLPNHRSARGVLRSRDPTPIFLAAQVVTLAAAMATDYVVELPYGKLQLFLVAALAVGRSAKGDEDGRKPRSRRGQLVAMGVTALAALVSLPAVTHLQKAQVAAEMQRRYELALVELQTTGQVERARLEGILALGERFQGLPGGDKTSYRAQLVMGHSAHLLGRSDVALAAASQAIRLHPHSADALGLMARIVPEPCASSWHRARTYVLDEATAGFAETYPSCGLPPS